MMVVCVLPPCCASLPRREHPTDMNHRRAIAPPRQVKKQKTWEAIAAELATDGARIATFQGAALVASTGKCVAPTLANSHIS